jgi:peptidyl-prolyl cis-trans isomerase B (cyclophilin B)
VIQGGDPEGNGMGGPGYSVVDVPPKDTTYEKGLVAMAKTQTDPAGTSGSQFFVVTSDGVTLPPDYAVLGQVTDGMDVVEKIGKLGNPADPAGTPTEKVTIDKMELESG